MLYPHSFIGRVRRLSLESLRKIFNPESVAIIGCVRSQELEFIATPKKRNEHITLESFTIRHAALRMLVRKPALAEASEEDLFSLRWFYGLRSVT